MTSASIACLMMMSLARVTSAQAPVPVRELGAPEAVSSERYGNIFAVRQIARGHVLVNDGVNRQLLELDDKLSRTRAVLDSNGTDGNSYGPLASPLISYLGDSSLFVDGTSLSLLVIDGNGKVVRTIAAPSRNDFRFLAGSRTSVDQRAICCIASAQFRKK